MPTNKQLLTAIGILAVLWSFFCIFYIGLNPLGANQPPDQLYQFMSYSITAVSGTLATFLGMVLGFRQANVAPVPAGQPVAAVTRLTWVQTIAAWAYVASLIIGLVLWGTHRTDADVVIQNLGKSFLGLIGGVLVVVLNVTGDPPAGP